MRRIERKPRFKRDYRRELSGVHGKNLGKVLSAAVELLATNHTLPEQLRDHALIGRWKGYRDCHLRPDLVLVYRKTPGALELVRLGSHSELFG